MAKTLQNMIDEGQAAQAAAPTPTPVAPVIPVAESTVVPVVPAAAEVIPPESPVAEVTPTDAVEPTPAEEVKDAKSWLRDFLEKHGKHVDGLPDSELEAFAERKLFADPTPAQPVVQAAPVQVAPVVPVVAPTEAKTPTTPSRKVARLQYDQALATMVTFDEDGQAIPNPSFGAAAIEAAAKVNQYSASRRKRVEDLVDDPIEFLKDDMLDIVREEMRAQIGKEFETFKSSQQTEYQKFEAERARMAEGSAVNELLSSNKAKLYLLGKDGEPAKSLDTNLPILSPYGSAVDEQLKELEALSPNAAQSALIAQAIKIVDKIFGQPAKPTPQTIAEKKQAFLEKDKQHVVPVTPDRPQASLADTIANHAPMSLAEMIKRNEANVGNPVLAELS